MRHLTDALKAEVDARYGGRPGSGAEPAPWEFTPPEGAFLVGYEDGEPLACGGVCRYDERTAEIRRMYVVPTARGRGLSRQILAGLEEEASTLGYERIRLETGNLQPEAIGLYHSAGYEQVDCYGPYVADERSVCFEKSV